jgi:hypothetical protein
MRLQSVRGNKLISHVLKEGGDRVWNREDWGRYATFDARWTSMGVSEYERAQLLPCAVWKSKFPGMTYNPTIESRLRSLCVG